MVDISMMLLPIGWCKACVNVMHLKFCRFWLENGENLLNDERFPLRNLCSPTWNRQGCLSSQILEIHACSPISPSFCLWPYMWFFSANPMHCHQNWMFIVGVDYRAVWRQLGQNHFSWTWASPGSWRLDKHFLIWHLLIVFCVIADGHET